MISNYRPYNLGKMQKAIIRTHYLDILVECGEKIHAEIQDEMWKSAWDNALRNIVLPSSIYTVLSGGMFDENRV